MIILIILLLALLLVVILAMLHHTKYLQEQVSDTAILLITVPKPMPRKEESSLDPDAPRDFKEAQSSSEQFLDSLYSIYQPGFLRDILGEQAVIGLEIVTINNLISFYITCPRRFIERVEKQVHAHFPDANIEQVKGYGLFDIKNAKVAGASLRLSKKFVYPIKTYRNMDHDPLNGITGALSKMGTASNAGIQVLIKPISEKWRVAPASAARQVMDGKTDYLHTSLGSKMLFNSTTAVSKALNTAISKPGQPPAQEENQQNIRHTPLQEDLMKAFGEKSSKTGFKVIVRIIAVAPSEQEAAQDRDNIISSFAQFNAPAWNSFRFNKKVATGRIAKDYIMRAFSHDSEMTLNSEEIASFWHIPNQFIDTPNIRWLLSKTLPPPVNLPQEGIILGESVYRGETRPVRIKVDDRRRHLFMIGKTGVGKTTLFENMIDQDILAGKGVAYIDPNGDAIESILRKIPKERAEDVVIFDPSDAKRPVGLNMLEWKIPEEKDFLIAEWLEIFYKLFDPNKTGIVGPQFEHWGRNAALTVMGLPQGGTLIDIPRLFTDEEFQKYAIGFVKDPLVKDFWEKQLAKTADFHKSEMYNYFISKFGRFMTNDLMRNIIGQARSGFDIREIMDKGKILLVNLSKGKIGEMNSYLLGMVIVSKIQTAAFSRADTPEEERKDFYLYVDEFQNFTTDTFATILSEARKYHLSLNITNQYIAQLTETIRDAVIGNAGTIIAYRVGAADAEFMVKEFPGVSIDDMVNADKFTTYTKLLIDGTPSKPFSMKGILSPIQKDEQRAEAIRQLSRMKYGKDKQEVDKEFIGRIKQGRSSAPPPGVNEPLSRV